MVKCTPQHAGGGPRQQPGWLGVVMAIAVFGFQPYASAQSATTATAAASTTAAKPAPSARQLRPGVRIERVLSHAQVHTYELRMERGDYVHLTVDQQGVDVVVRLIRPGGDLLTTVDAIDDAFEPERVTAIAGDPGRYRIEVSRSSSAPPRGRYAIRIDDLRPAEPQDSVRIDADRAFAHGRELRASGRPATSARRPVRVRSRTRRICGGRRHARHDERAARPGRSAMAARTAGGGRDRTASRADRPRPRRSIGD